MQPISDEAMEETCGNACPTCTDSISNTIFPVQPEGLTYFLVHTFIRDACMAGPMTGDHLMIHLKKIENVGKVIYVC